MIFDDRVFYRASNCTHKVGEYILPKKGSYQPQSDTQEVTERVIKRFNEQYSLNRTQSVYFWRDKRRVENLVRSNRYKFGYGCIVDGEDLIQLGNIDNFNELDEAIKCRLVEKNLMGQTVPEGFIDYLFSQKFVKDQVAKIIEPQKTYLETGRIPNSRNLEFLFKKAKVIEILPTHSQKIIAQYSYDPFSDVDSKTP